MFPGSFPETDLKKTGRDVEVLGRTAIYPASLVLGLFRYVLGEPRQLTTIRGAPVQGGLCWAVLQKDWQWLMLSDVLHDFNAIFNACLRRHKPAYISQLGWDSSNLSASFCGKICHINCTPGGPCISNSFRGIVARWESQAPLNVRKDRGWCQCSQS